MKHETVAILGAGKVGGNLGVNLSRHRYRVVFGVRSGRDIAGLLRRCGEGARAASVVEAAAAAGVVFLAVPAGAAVEVARSAGDLDGKVVVDCTNPVSWGEGPTLAPPPEGSVAAALAAALPRAHVVKGFNSFGAEVHLDPDLGGSPAEVYLAGDDGTAVEAVGTIAAHCGFAPISVGPLRNAALLEALAVLWIQLATQGGQGRQFAFRIARRA
jgi:predicted dinucleotide-binding enzyme